MTSGLTSGVTPGEAIRARLAGGPDAGDLGPLTVDGRAGEVRLERLDEVHARLESDADGTAVRATVLILPAEAGRRELVVDGWRFVVETEPERHAALRELARRGRADAPGPAATELRAVIPGRVLSVAVGEGESVAAGQPVLVVEAMKMQNDVRAPRAGTVARVAVAPGQTVELGDVMVVLE